MAELADTLTITEDDRLDQAEGRVRSYCGWHIAPSRTDTVRVAGAARVITLPSLHVTSVTSVTVGDTLLAADAYDCTEAGVLTLASHCGPRETVTVVFTHGYDIPPPEVTGVVQALAQAAVGNPTRVKSITRGPFSESYDSTFSADDKSILDRYKLPSRP